MIVEQQVRLTGVPLNTRVLRGGSGAPVLLLHGSPDDADEWRRVMEILDPGCACLAPDLPGFGKSDEPPPSFDYSRPAFAGFLDELLERLDVTEPLVLVIHDIGGVLGIPWAAANPGRLRGLVITNTVVFENFPWFGTARLWARSDFAGRLVASAFMRQAGWLGGRIFRAGFRRVSPELPEADLDRITRDFACNPRSKRSTLRLFRQMVPAEYFAGFDAMMARLIASTPVRVVWGRGDPYIPARYAGAFPGAVSEIVNRGGHWVPISAADRVAAAVRAVLEAEGRPA